MAAFVTQLVPPACLLVLLVQLVQSTSPPAGDGLVANEVVPDIILLAPVDMLSAVYPSGAVVSGGGELTPTQVKDQPTLSWPTDPDTLYTIVLTDPDAPSRRRPSFREFRHWLVVNVPGTDIARGDVVTEYLGSMPPRGTGLHRYVLLAYKQPKALTVERSLRQTKNQFSGRGRWSVLKFAEKYGLGVPVAGNVFQAQYES